MHEFTQGAHEDKRLTWLYRHGEVLAREDMEDGTAVLQVRLSEADRARFEQVR